jgi:hypothetical protein
MFRWFAKKRSHTDIGKYPFSLENGDLLEILPGVYMIDECGRFFCRYTTVTYLFKYL